jgi:hypothetical protein
VPSLIAKARLYLHQVCCALVLGIIALLVFTQYGRSLLRRTRNAIIPAKRRRPSLASLNGDAPVIEPFLYPPQAIRAQHSESSISKIPLAQPETIPLDTVSPPNLDTSTEQALSVEGVPDPASSVSRSATVPSRREKEDSLALLMPHLVSQGSSSVSHSSSLGPSIRETDSGPVDERSLSPILPPEYDPRWARR